MVEEMHGPDRHIVGADTFQSGKCVREMMEILKLKSTEERTFKDGRIGNERRRLSGHGASKKSTTADELLADMLAEVDAPVDDGVGPYLGYPGNAGDEGWKEVETALFFNALAEE